MSIDTDIRSNEKIEVMAVYSMDGVIAVIEPWGDVVKYKQKGLKDIKDDTLTKLISSNALSTDVRELDEIPENYNIYFEDEEIQGRIESKFELSKCNLVKKGRSVE